MASTADLLFLLVVSLFPLTGRPAEIPTEAAQAFKEGIEASDEGDWCAVIEAMKTAVGIASDRADLDIRLYGQRFEAYLPTYHLGMAYARSGSCELAGKTWNSVGGREFLRMQELRSRARQLQDDCQSPEDMSVTMTIGQATDTIWESESICRDAIGAVKHGTTLDFAFEASEAFEGTAEDVQWTFGDRQKQGFEVKRGFEVTYLACSESLVELRVGQTQILKQRIPVEPPGGPDPSVQLVGFDQDRGWLLELEGTEEQLADQEWCVDDTEDASCWKQADEQIALADEDPLGHREIHRRSVSCHAELPSLALRLPSWSVTWPDDLTAERFEVSVAIEHLGAVDWDRADLKPSLEVQGDELPTPPPEVGEDSRTYTFEVPANAGGQQRVLDLVAGRLREMKVQPAKLPVVPVGDPSTGDVGVSEEEVAAQRRNADPTCEPTMHLVGPTSIGPFGAGGTLQIEAPSSCSWSIDAESEVQGALHLSTDGGKLVSTVTGTGDMEVDYHLSIRLGPTLKEPMEAGTLTLSTDASRGVAEAKIRRVPCSVRLGENYDIAAESTIPWWSEPDRLLEVSGRGLTGRLMFWTPRGCPVEQDGTLLRGYKLITRDEKADGGVTVEFSPSHRSNSPVDEAEWVMSYGFKKILGEPEDGERREFNEAARNWGAHQKISVFWETPHSAPKKLLEIRQRLQCDSKLEPETLEVGAGGGRHTLQLIQTYGCDPKQFELLRRRRLPGWVTVDDRSGNQATVTVLPNEGEERKTNLRFVVGTTKLYRWTGWWTLGHTIVRTEVIQEGHP